MNVRNISLGVYGGLAGGVAFGAMMGATGMLTMIGKMVGYPSAGAGFVVHLINSALIGAGFAVVFGKFVNGTSRGLLNGSLYGGFWWLLGPLTLMPLFMGMGLGINWNTTATVAMLPSLGGHVMYGAILGVVYAWLRARSGAYAAAPISSSSHKH